MKVLQNSKKTKKQKQHNPRRNESLVLIEGQNLKLKNCREENEEITS
jgi:hypothetical protein